MTRDQLMLLTTEQLREILLKHYEVEMTAKENVLEFNSIRVRATLRHGMDTIRVDVWSDDCGYDRYEHLVRIAVGDWFDFTQGAYTWVKPPAGECRVRIRLIVMIRVVQELQCL